MLPLGFLRVALKVLTTFVEYGFLLLDLSVALRVHQNFVGFPSGHPRVFKDSLLSSHFFSSSWRLKGFSVLLSCQQSSNKSSLPLLDFEFLNLELLQHIVHVYFVSSSDSFLPGCCMLIFHDYSNHCRENYK